MKVGDLVEVGLPPHGREFVSIVLNICSPKNHRNGMYLIQVVENGVLTWYPVGYIKVLNASR